ncbi:MAG: NADH-dependent alcohol dehydrogenase, partial [Lachnospiraceae bacterium]|nr:NADH-dependent alcohol dehydrogenase [Lachnospiraceae bacterium]
MEDFYHRIGMPTNMKELGIEPTDEQIRKMAQRCMAACGNRTGSAKALTEEDMVAIYMGGR